MLPATITLTKECNRSLINFIAVFLMVSTITMAQNIDFEIEKTSFSSSVAHDFSPVFYKNGLVYCSNEISDAVVSIKSENENLFHIVYVQQKDSGKWKAPVLFSPELTSILNDGPCTFTADGNSIYFARNNKIEGKFKDINSPDNTLGIYQAELINGIWSNIRLLSFCNAAYSYGTPSLSPDGTRLYFASDKPGGFGGTDIYSSNISENGWTTPVNLGSRINTSGDESYPFAGEDGKLFFSSTGHKGFGGKDIFLTREMGGHWAKPVHLSADINSQADDFGIITNRNFEWGYFSSNRKSTSDIYSFRSVLEQFGPCDSLSAYNKCYAFYDERFTDSLHLEYEWDFGHGIRKKGLQVEQCFSKPGNYSAVLTIINHLADSTFETKSIYNFTVEPPEYPYISADTTGVANEELELSATTGTQDFSAYTFYWNTGDGYKKHDLTITKSFSNPGEYTVKFGLKGEKDEKGLIPKFCFSKSIKIVKDYYEKAYLLQLNYKEQQTKVYTHPSNNKLENYRIVTFLFADLEALEANKITSSLQALSDRYFSITESGELTQESIAVIDSLSNILMEYGDIKILLALHEDSKGSQKNKLEQSQLIANNINNYLASKSIDGLRIQCVAFGDSRPVAEKNSKDESLRNKRMECIIIN